MPDYLVTLRGTLSPGTLTEIFSHQIAVVSSRSDQQVATDAATTWAAAWNDATNVSLKPAFSPTVAYTEATCAEILDFLDGALSAAYHAPITGVAGTGVAALPSQNAVAVSLTGGTKPNGTPMKGRFYLPTPSAAAILTATGLLASSAQAAMTKLAADWIDAMNLLGDIVCIWSRRWTSFNVVEQVRVGDRVDTIRRRRNAKPESYAIEPIAGPQLAAGESWRAARTVAAKQ